MGTRTEVCQITGNFTASIDSNTSLDYAQSTVDTWRAFAAVLREQKYHHDGCDIRVQVDWEPIYLLIAEELRDSLDEFSELHPGMVKVVMYRLMLPEEKRIYDEKTSPSLSAHVEISGQNELSNSEGYPEFFVETYLYDLFLILNLALPGSADFHNVTIQSICGFTKRLSLSAYPWWSAYQEKDQWPLLNAIDPNVVATWFYSVRRGFAQVPETSVERAMFAMLHVCRSDGRPEDIVWLFYAFESLFQTRAGENFSTLLERLKIILQPNSKQEKELSKQLRAMYDLRSSFIHGGFSIIHPIHSEVMDKRVDDSYGKIINLSTYGAKLLLACLQRYVQEGWREVRYRTTVEPINQ